MNEGPVRIIMSIKEPENHYVLWMRPFLDKEGYEILYYGSKGWTVFLPCCHQQCDNKSCTIHKPSSVDSDTTLTELPDCNLDDEGECKCAKTKK